jgi:AmmeMemoRadiSam system protein B
MTHYESHTSASEKDHYALEAILNLDERELISRIGRKNISMCGYGPVIVTLTAAKILGAKKAQLIKYTTSAETSGDYDQVVGYAGVLIA